MRDYKWRTINSGARYVDSSTGSDLYGDGTMTNPYQTLGRAYRASVTKPSVIICRGRFSEAMEDGNHSCAINGDYYGAATFDGNDSYVIYGFRHSNMIIKNTSTSTYDLNVWTGSAAFAGVGSAAHAGAVGATNAVYGLLGSPVLLDNTTLYWGVAGGNTACQYICYSKVRNNGIYKVSLGGQSIGITNALAHNTYYDVEIANRSRNLTTGNSFLTFGACIFAKFDLFANDYIKYDGCLFTSDSKWYYNNTEIVITGTTSEDREESLMTQIIGLGIAENQRPTFANCKFTTQTSYDIFNNPDKYDFTLKPDGDGVIDNDHYYGAFPPSLNVPILDNSTSVPGTWNENSASGILKVINDTICLDETSTETKGEIVSKAIKIDVNKYSLNAIFSDYASKFMTYSTYLWDDELTGTTYYAEEIIPQGKYIVKGDIYYGDENIRNNTIVNVTEDNTSFTSDNPDSKLIDILDGNISDVCYVRTTPVIYQYLKSGDALQRGGLYVNFGEENITYNAQTIVPNESFVAMNDSDTFTAGSPDYEVGILFDDTRVPSQEWVPAQLFGEYFVWKKDGVIQVDNYGIPISSGNYLSYQTTANGGYSNTLIKTPMNHKYIQFKFVAQKYDSTN